MKLSLYLLAYASTLGFSSAWVATSTPRSSSRVTLTGPRFMFGGAGQGVPAEDDSEAMQQMEATAKALGMTVEEYKLGVNARLRLTSALDAARLTGGNAGTVAVERDGHNPPQFLEITITEAGKAQGKEAVSKQLVEAFKTCSEASKKTRAEAQKDMMTYITQEMKRMGG